MASKSSRFRKSDKQLLILNDYKDRCPGAWDQKLIKEISHESGLPRDKVYKWFWDQRRKVQGEQNLV
jgi:hypothetical protein